MDNSGLALMVAGWVFALFGLVHLIRLFTKFELKIAGKAIPVWASILGLIFAAGLSFWMFSVS